MRNYVLLLFLVALFGLSGCAGSPAAIALTSQSDIAEMSNNRLINYWRSRRAEKFATEIERRKIFTPKEWESIKKGNVFIGMRAEAVRASAGSSFKKIEYASKKQKHIVWRYRTASIAFGPNNRVTEILKF